MSDRYELIKAVKGIVAAWESGDLAAAVNSARALVEDESAGEQRSDDRTARFIWRIPIKDALDAELHKETLNWWLTDRAGEAAPQEVQLTDWQAESITVDGQDFVVVIAAGEEVVEE